MPSTVLDYAGYFELVCVEECACYNSYPSAADVIRSAASLADPSDFPADPSAVPYEYYDSVLQYYINWKRERHQLFGRWDYHSCCPYCGAELEISPGNPTAQHSQQYYLGTCLSCGWWESETDYILEENDKEPQWYRSSSLHRRSVLREFSVGGSKVPLEALRSHVARHPDELRAIAPRQLERLVGKVFGDVMNCEAIHLGGPNDGGIDLLLINGDRTYAIQVKRRQADRAEAVSSVREFLGAMVSTGAVRGIFVSTAPRFSRQAQGIAQVASARKAVECIELISADRLIEALKLTAAGAEPPWERARGVPVPPTHRDNGLDVFLTQFMGHPDWKVSSARPSAEWFEQRRQQAERKLQEIRAQSMEGTLEHHACVEGP